MAMTKEQQAAVYTRDKNLLVSASAGSGKTFVMVKRIISLIVEEEISIESLLIVTFTNAAAAEMRTKIAAALMQAIKEYPDKKKFIAQQIQRLHLAQISTLHAFCKNVLKQNFFQIDIDPNFKIGVEQILSMLKNEVLADIFMEKYQEQDEDFQLLLNYYASASSDSKLRALIFKIYNFAMANVNPMLWLDQASELYDNIDENHWLLKAVDEHKKEEISRVISEFERLLEIASEPDAPYTYIAGIEADIAMLEANLLKREPQFSFAKLKAVPKKDRDLVDVEKQEYIKNKRKDLKKQIDDLALFYQRPLSEQIEDLSENALVLKKLTDLVKEFIAAYSLAKAEENLLDFNDLEQFAIRCLSIDAVAELYRERFQYIFVDEYQDSNPVQEAIINLIKRDNNLFFVGDVKQSIYGFRLASPALFLEKFDDYPKQVLSERIDLNANFRSHPIVLKAINDVFNVLMSKEFGGLDYKRDAQLISLNQDYKEMATPVACWAYAEENKTKEEVSYALLAKRIQELLDTSFYCLEDERERNYTYDDIVILLRSTSKVAPEIASALAKYGIPVAIDTEDNYFELIEVATFINFLKIIDNPLDDLAMLSVLRSFIGGLDDNDLARLASKRAEGEYYYETIENLIKAENADDKLIDFYNLLQFLRNQRHLLIGEFIWLCLETSNYYNYVLGLENGKIRARHLELLAEKANDFERNGLNGLHHFVDYLERLKTMKIGFGGRSEQVQQNVVKIMTIHKSKGLEFNAVIIANSDKQFNFMDIRGDVYLHSKLAIVSKWCDPANYLKRTTLAMYYLKEVLRQQTLEEEMRLLYVAMTRAKYHLEMHGYVKDENSAEKKWQTPVTSSNLKACNNYFDWLMIILTQESNNWQQLCYQASDLELSESQLEQDKKQQFVDLLADVEPLAFDFYRGLNSKAPAKMTVSELKNAEEGGFRFKLTDLSDNFADSDTSLLKGNIYHKIMENLSFKETSIEEVIVGASEYLTEEQLALIDISKIEIFIQSSLFQRVQSASKIYQEQPFVYNKEIAGEKILVQGIIDLFFIEDDEVVLVDYKSDMVRNANILKQRYAKQLELYAEAIEKSIQKRVKQALIYSVYLGEVVEISALSL